MHNYPQSHTINTARKSIGGQLLVMLYFPTNPPNVPPEERLALLTAGCTTGGKASYPPAERHVLLFMIFPTSPPNVPLEERPSSKMTLFRALKNFPLKRIIISQYSVL